MIKREYGYYIAQAPKIAELVELVLKQMKEGYSLAGGVCVVPTSSGYGYIQALVLDKITEEKK